MSRLLIVFLGLFFFVFIDPVLSEEADPAAVVWATDYLKACKEGRTEEAVSMMAPEVRFRYKPAEAAAVVKELAEFLKGQDPKLSFSHRASGGMHGSLFTTSKGDITITVYRNSGLWQVVSVDFKPDDA